MSVNPIPMIEELRMGSLIVTGVPSASSLPLEHTDVVAHVSGPLASVSVAQRFGNSFSEPVELAYLFPLPHGAAIVDYELRIGQRVIRADMKELEEARRTYSTARDQGQRAGLLEQRRRNLFSIELANVQPGETILATIRYQERLRYDDGCYSFVFPMGITPKYHRDPAEAAKVDAPVAAAGDSIGTVDIGITVDGGGPADDPNSPSHEVEITRMDERRFGIRLLGHVIPNKDFVLRYRVADTAVRAAACTSISEGGATVLITALPPRLTDDSEPSPREFIFVIDRSGSMSGEPLLQARNALRSCLRSMGPQDTFNIQAFDDRVEWFSESANLVAQAAVERADKWLERIDARGGTDILGAIDSVLMIDSEPERQRYIVFLTDGAVSADDEALRRVQRGLGRARLFTFGIGPSVNRSLLMRMADVGHGTAEFLQLNEDIEEAIIRFQDRVAYPVLQDITLDWEGVTAWDVYPACLPDLYIGQPLELVARIRATGQSPGRLTISGRSGNLPVALEVELPPSTTAEPIITRAWARARVDALLDGLRDEPGQMGALRSEIIGLAIAHRLLTPFTAFVAVDSEVTEKLSDKQTRVSVGVPLPEGLKMEGFFDLLTLVRDCGASLAAAPMSAVIGSATPNSGPAHLLRRARSFFRDTASPDAVQMDAAQMMDRSEPRIAASAPFSEIGSGQQQTLEELLRWLARSQNVSGSWGAGETEVEQTAAAVLAFVRAGHTHRGGHYRRQLARATKWLLTATAQGLAEYARAQALAELAAATGDPKIVCAAQSVQTVAPRTSIALTEPLSTLDELRAAALARQVKQVAPTLFSGSQADLARVWMAALMAGQ
ncbi:MAG TPA: VIT domain-containing protein [Blastocatellia bacterium]|nr:VIT domain-containing protein [Blastocatellia bacterium]